jgi:hypothetical protein
MRPIYAQKDDLSGARTPWGCFGVWHPAVSRFPGKRAAGGANEVAVPNNYVRFVVRLRFDRAVVYRMVRGLAIQDMLISDRDHPLLHLASLLCMARVVHRVGAF